MVKRLTSALIGAGRIAQSLHLPAHLQIQGSALKWVCDTNEEAARSLAEQHGIPNWTGRLADVLADAEVDWVDVAVPNRFHEAVTVQALQAGKHVLCQKPMADSVEAAERMAATAAAAGRQLGMFMCFRGDEALRLVRAMIREGAFGSIISFRGKMLSSKGTTLREGDWRMDDASGALDLLGIHLLDLFAWLHSDIEWVQAYANTLYAQMKGDDITTAVYGLKDGATAVMETFYSSYTYPGMSLYTLEVNGTDGLAQYKMDTGELTLQLRHDYQAGATTCKGGQATRLKLAHALKDGEALANEHQAFVDALHSGQPFEADGAAGLQALRVLYATREAARSGQRLAVRRP